MATLIDYISDDAKNILTPDLIGVVQRRSFAGLAWSMQVFREALESGRYDGTDRATARATIVEKIELTERAMIARKYLDDNYGPSAFFRCGQIMKLSERRARA